MSRLDVLLAALDNPALPNIDLSLTRMQALLAALDHPEEKLPPVIHIAGTNGKGSTLAFLKAIYMAAGYKVHAYTSPHLVRFSERIMLAGEEIGEAALTGYLDRIADAAASNPVTFFEATTAASFLVFAETPADVLLLEVGLGGRLDATNVVARPLATVITPISIDHAEFLGNALNLIAAEKAGILKPGVPCVLGMQEAAVRKIIAEKAQGVGAPLFACGEAWNFRTEGGVALLWNNEAIELGNPALEGAHQFQNAALAAATALSLASQLPVTAEHLRRGIATAQWPARLQPLREGPLVAAWNGPVMLDGAHNEAAGVALASWIAAQTQPVFLLVGMMRRKDAEAFLRPLAKVAAGIACIPIEGYADAYAPETLAEAAALAGFREAFVAQTPLMALSRWADKKGVLLVTGSLFLAGEILKNHE